MGLFGGSEKQEAKKQKQLQKELANEERVNTQKKAILNVEGAQEHFEEGEELIEYIFGMYDSKVLGSSTKRNGVLVATNLRIIFYGKKTFGYDMETIDYNKISSVDYSKGMAFGKLVIFTSGNKIEFQTTAEHASRSVMKIIKEHTKQKESESTTIINSNEKSIAEELKELKELVDMDIITQEEFDAKKAQILGI